MLPISVWLALLTAIVAPASFAAPPTPGLGHYYGNGHAELAWTNTTIPPSWDATGTGTLTTNLASLGEATVFQVPLTAFELRVLPPGAPMPYPTSGRMVMEVPGAGDPWWTTYPGGMPGGITTGGTIEFRLMGHVEHHAYATTIYGTFVVVSATGQYTGMASRGEWSGSATGGPGSFGSLYDFAVIGDYS